MKPRTRSQNGRRSRAKGAAFEREVALALRGIYPGAERCIAQTRTAAREGCDVEGTPFWIECKVGGRPNVLAAMRQAKRDRVGGKGIADDVRPVLVVAQRTREPATVTIELEAFVEMLSRSELAHRWGENLAILRNLSDAMRANDVQRVLSRPRDEALVRLAIKEAPLLRDGYLDASVARIIATVDREHAA